MPLPATRPLWCLVTDRRRIGGGPALVRLIGAAVEAGVDLVQVRELDLSGRDLADLVRGCLDVARGTPTRILVNDRADVAIACGAHGVHLRGDSVAASRLRPIVPLGFLLGRSVHRVSEATFAVEAGGLDYLIAGTVMPTSSKPASHAYLGLEGLRSLVDGVSIPVLAIGGVRRDTIAAILDTGVAGVAAMGAFCELDGDASAIASLLHATGRSFDTSKPVS